IREGVSGAEAELAHAVPAAGASAAGGAVWGAGRARRGWVPETVGREGGRRPGGAADDAAGGKGGQAGSAEAARGGAAQGPVREMDLGRAERGGRQTERAELQASVATVDGKSLPKEGIARQIPSAARSQDRDTSPSLQAGGEGHAMTPGRLGQLGRCLLAGHISRSETTRIKVHPLSLFHPPCPL
ncbi:hypothetical protein EW146_g3723, partial [Bondarzewia mesenterica]